MRTPNTKCLLCEKPLYRRPNELEKVRYVACLTCRDQAKRTVGLSDREKAGLAKGRVKGTNHRKGCKHKPESKRKASEANKAYWAAHPEQAMARGAKVRGPLSPRWKGGPKRLNLSVRRMTEYRRWAGAVVARDGKCVDCGSAHNIEADHVKGLAELLVEHRVTNRDEARQCSALWDVSNGRTLCEGCHYKRHGRTPPTPEDRKRAAIRRCEVCGVGFKVKPSQVSKGQGRFCSKGCAGAARKGQSVGAGNPNWKGGEVRVKCVRCGDEFAVKPSIFARGGGRFCSRECVNADRRSHL